LPRANRVLFSVTVSFYHEIPSGDLGTNDRR
jgi:hypothetical protein